MELLTGESLARELELCDREPYRQIAVVLRDESERVDFVNQLYRLLISPTEDSSAATLAKDATIGWSIDISTGIFRNTKDSFIFTYTTEKAQSFYCYDKSLGFYSIFINTLISDKAYAYNGGFDSISDACVKAWGSSDRTSTVISFVNGDKIEVSEKVDEYGGDKELTDFIDGFKRKETQDRQ